MFLKGDTRINCLLNGDWTILEATCVVSTIGSTCNSSIDCKETGAECLVGKCFCGRLYRYDANTKDCVKVCSATKDTFTVYEKTRIGAYNDLGRVKEITITECREQCAGNDDCLSFEYYEEEGICNWSSVTMEMIEDAFPEIIKPDPKDLYSRDCS
ncbi:uncharacterized protein LOC123536971 [Mercenaria mercenaria]|uniref:uncharacterized protein LOC123536971 n=1 Tax=Mercenaria mercenaria TaxID=6596 RepID=UPI00234E444F|nr:uncharacterized protein LOC123536971 [Mercenaria mercenaria]